MEKRKLQRALAFIVLFTLVEIGVTVYKTLRYGAPIRNR